MPDWPGHLALFTHFNVGSTDIREVRLYVRFPLRAGESYRIQRLGYPCSRFSYKFDPSWTTARPAVTFDYEDIGQARNEGLQSIRLSDWRELLPQGHGDDPHRFFLLSRRPGEETLYVNPFQRGSPFIPGVAWEPGTDDNIPQHPSIEFQEHWITRQPVDFNSRAEVEEYLREMFAYQEFKVFRQ